MSLTKRNIECPVCYDSLKNCKCTAEELEIAEAIYNQEYYDNTI